MHEEVAKAYTAIVEAFATGTTHGTLRGALINWDLRQVDVLEELGS